MSHLYVQWLYHPTPSHTSTKEQHTESNEKYNTTEKKYYRRLLAVLYKNNGRTFADIAREHDVSIRSVQRWISAYIQMGTEGREIKKTSSTKSSIRTDEKNREIMLSVLFNHPNIFGYISNTWSLGSLANKVSYRRT